MSSEELTKIDNLVQEIGFKHQPFDETWCEWSGGPSADCDACKLLRVVADLVRAVEVLP